MCNNIAYVMAAATGTRKESERPAEWKTDGEEAEDDEREEPVVAAA
jgi:hypothetical protein